MSADSRTKYKYPKRMFLLYDGRAKPEYGGDTDRAIVMDTASSEREAGSASRRDWRDYDAIWYECELLPDEREPTYGNEKPRPDLGKGFLLF